MTPEQARELYATASTPPEVCALLRARRRDTEAKYVESIQAWLTRDPAAALQNLRAMADDEESLAKERISQIAEAFESARPQLRREALAHEGRSRSLRWAATALTRGLASGKLQALPVLKQTDESPCTCGGPGDGLGGFHYQGAPGCLAVRGEARA